MNFRKTLEELRRINKKRRFDQSVDLIINLKDFDPKRESLEIFIILPHGPKKKIAGFLEHPSPHVYSITKNEIERLSVADLRKLAKQYDFFVANAKLMPLIAQKFGKVLGSLGKMPDPKLGAVLLQESDKAIAEVAEKLSRAVKIKAKEPSLKLMIGKESMPDEEIIENANAVMRALIPALPKKEANLKSILLKFTMSKPVKVEIEK